ncbi:tail fiber domain-containing protein [Aporhodopirellula aestuarii]|uniref:Tail fiber domain-containing protein n=1 Tax=Aporhodopirellula aestuarii TaxID=2950107 RepID=A0ABT0UCG4_9BACT|nr:tail fiber domain-containing protein [Aporhodopirellula aestuarii]MCM2374707.1 tail fiber domain-containing protein [Aporhodopirellula aestuarii]
MKTQIVLMLVSVCFCTMATAQESARLLPFQGHLTQPKMGSPGKYEPVANGKYSILMSLYTEPTGGTRIWDESHKDVPVVNGLVNLIAGSIKPLPAGEVFGNVIFVGITIDEDGDPTTPDLEMVPRQQLIPALFAHSAFKAKEAKRADIAKESGHATTADFAKEAQHAAVADKASKADTATKATSATSATKAANADKLEGHAWSEVFPKSGGQLGGQLILHGKGMRLGKASIHFSQKAFNFPDRTVIDPGERLDVSGGVLVSGNTTVKKILDVEGPFIRANKAKILCKSLVEVSSRDIKEDVSLLTPDCAAAILEQLEPVSFRYKGSDNEKHLGFIAEDTPRPVSDVDGKAIQITEVVTVLTKVVQTQQKQIDQLMAEIAHLKHTRTTSN